MKDIRIIVSGGGTGGHIYPAVSVVETLEKRLGKEHVEVLFVGAEGKMEMQKVPALGYRIVGLPVVGLQRRLTLKNLKVPFRVMQSLLKARKVLSGFKPDIVVGFGGYASLPLLWQAQRMGYPTVLWEGNSFAGMANRMLSRKADRVCVSYDNMERFFGKDKIVITGNPVRGRFDGLQKKSPESLEYFGFREERPILLVTGGSLGARVINESVMKYMERLVSEKKINLIWQVGGYYFEEMKERMKPYAGSDNVWMAPFIDRMDYAYAVADLVVARAGASTVTELSLAGVPALFIPASGVTDDHQTKNARSLVDKGAAEMLSDAEAVEKMLPFAETLLADKEKLAGMAQKIKEFAVRDSADIMVNIVLEEAEKKYLKK